MLDKVKSVSDYLKAYGSKLAEKITKEAEPLFNPGDCWDKKMALYSGSRFLPRVM